MTMTSAVTVDWRRLPRASGALPPGRLGAYRRRSAPNRTGGRRAVRVAFFDLVLDRSDSFTPRATTISSIYESAPGYKAKIEIMSAGVRFMRVWLHQRALHPFRPRS